MLIKGQREIESGGGGEERGEEGQGGEGRGEKKREERITIYCLLTSIVFIAMSYVLSFVRLLLRFLCLWF